MTVGWRKGLLAAGWNVHRAIELAIEVETMGEATYRRLARRWESEPALRALLGRLASEEVGHRWDLEQLLDDLDVTGSASSLGAEALRALAHETFFSRKGGPLGDLEWLESPAEVLETVLRFERGTTLYYRGLRDVVGPSCALDLLIAEEVRHAEELARELRALRPELEGAAGRGAA